MRTIDERRLRVWKDKFQSLCKMVLNEDSASIYSEDGWKAVRKLTEEILKERDLPGIIGPNELDTFIMAEVEKVEDGWPKEPLEVQFAVDQGFDNLLALVTGVPFKYNFFYKLPFPFPAGMPAVEIGHGIRISSVIPDVKEADFKSAIDVFWIGLPQLEAPKWGDVYVVVSSLGYGAVAKAEATSKLKEFLYLSESVAIVRRNHRKKSFSFDQDFYVSNGVEKGLLRSDIQDNVKGYLSRLRLRGTKLGISPDQPVKAEDVPGILDKFKETNRRFSTLRDKHSKNTEHISAAIEWAFDSQANDNETFSFVQTCIGIEAILGDKEENEKRGVMAKLSDRCAYLLGTSKSSRQNIAETFEKIYDLRSKLVHGTKYRLSDDEQFLSVRAARLLRELINREILYASGDLDSVGLAPFSF